MFMEKGILPHFEMVTFTPNANVSLDLTGPKSLLGRYHTANGKRQERCTVECHLVARDYST